MASISSLASMSFNFIVIFGGQTFSIFIYLSLYYCYVNQRVNKAVVVVKAIREVKVGKAAGPSEVSAEMIAASGEIGIGVMVERVRVC